MHEISRISRIRERERKRKGEREKERDATFFKNLETFAKDVILWRYYHAVSVITL
jgi:hypothetical protein